MPDPTFDATMMFTVTHHRGYVDGAGIVCIRHVIKVIADLATEDEWTVAALYDVVEKRGVALDYLRTGMRYPATIIEAVDCLMMRPGESEDYYNYIRRISYGPLLARKVKIGDLKAAADLSHLPSPTDDDRRRSERYLAAIHILEVSLEPPDG